MEAADKGDWDLDRVIIAAEAIGSVLHGNFRELQTKNWQCTPFVWSKWCQ